MHLVQGAASPGKKQVSWQIPPIVLSWYSWNCPLTNLSTRLDFPTADSPSKTSLNWYMRVFCCCAPFGCCMAVMMATQNPTNSCEQATL